jgi:hypothetical protein
VVQVVESSIRQGLTMPDDDTPRTTLPDFAPVPRQRRKLTGWTPEVQRAFIEVLAETGSVRAACRAVKRSDHGAYMLRRHPEAHEFRAAWEAALDIGMQRIEDIAMDRAINGVEQPHYAYGKLLGTRTRYNDRLLMFMLRNRRPDRFTGGRPKALSAADKQTLERLKKEWRAEWKREQYVDIEDVRASILAKVNALEKADRARWTPREQELHEALQVERARRKARDEEEERARWRDMQANWRRWEEELEGEEEAEAEPQSRLAAPEAEEEGEEERAEGPRIRTLKDERW